jgi:urease accessory protein
VSERGPAVDVRGLLVALQLGDSLFPSGAASHSFGLEGLHGDGALPDAAAVEKFLTRQIEGRWATSDCVALMAAHAAAGDLDRVAEIDDHVERSVPVAGWRAAGRRLGRALLTTHARLGTPGAAAYAARVEAGRAPGQGCVVQGLVAAGCGLSAAAAAALSGYGAGMMIVSAALRLGIIGHLDAQRMLAGQRARIAATATAPARPLEAMSAWVPSAEVAAMRHEPRAGRLFAS